MEPDAQKLSTLMPGLLKSSKRKKGSAKKTVKNVSVPLSTTGLPSPERGESKGIGMQHSATGYGMSLSGRQKNVPTKLKSEDGASPLQWVEEWKTGDPVPSKEIMAKATDEVHRLLTPVDAKTGMVLLDQTMGLFGTPDNWSEIAEFYLEAIEDLPEDLLRKALKHVRMTYKNFIPKPAHIREHVEGEYKTRISCASKLRMMYMFMD